MGLLQTLWLVLWSSVAVSVYIVYAAEQRNNSSSGAGTDDNPTPDSNGGSYPAVMIYLVFSFYWVVNSLKNIVHVTVAGERGQQPHMLHAATTLVCGSVNTTFSLIQFCRSVCVAMRCCVMTCRCGRLVLVSTTGIRSCRFGFPSCRNFLTGQHRVRLTAGRCYGCAGTESTHV